MSNEMYVRLCLESDLYMKILRSARNLVVSFHVESNHFKWEVLTKFFILDFFVSNDVEFYLENQSSP